MKNKLNWLEAFLLLAPFPLLAFFWTKLPATIPTHWNLRGEIDGWSSKTFGTLLIPGIALSSAALLRLLPRIDSKLRRSNFQSTRMTAALQIIRLAMSAFFLAPFLCIISAALGHQLPTAQFALTSVLLLLAVIGNYLGVIRPNYFVGIRTPWTLENPETWRATHRIGGRLIFFGSTILLVVQFFLPPRVFTFAFFSSAILLLIWALLYSWHHAHTRGAAFQSP